MRIIIRKGRKEGREEVRFPLAYKTWNSLIYLCFYKVFKKADDIYEM